MNIDTTYKRILLLTYPVALTAMCDTLMGAIDTIMVGRLGVTELAAVGIANMVSFWFFCILLGMFSGVNALVAQAYGAGNERGAGVAMWQGLYLAIACAAGLGLMWFVVPTIFRAAGGSDEVQTIAASYMRIRLFSGSGFALLLLASNFYRGIGRTIVPMWFALGECVLNVGFNYVLIFGKFGFPALGTDGAALGTLLAITLVGGALFASILASRTVRERYHIRSTWRFDRVEFGHLLRISWPIGVQSFMDMGAVVVFAALVNRLGEAQMAATNAAIQGWSLALMPVIALSVGATTLVGQCVGARQPDDARRVVKKLLRMGYVLNAVFAVIYLMVPVGFMSLFLKPEDLPQVLPYARPLLTVVVACMVFETQFNVAGGALRGTGDTRFPMMVNIGVAWGIFAPLALLVTPRYGVVGGWMCLIVFCALCAQILLWRLRGDRWLEAAYRPPAAPDEALEPSEPLRFPALAD